MNPLFKNDMESGITQNYTMIGWFWSCISRPGCKSCIAKFWTLYPKVNFNHSNNTRNVFLAQKLYGKVVLHINILWLVLKLYYPSKNWWPSLILTKFWTLDPKVNFNHSNNTRNVFLAQKVYGKMVLHINILWLVLKLY